jgi:hypothetical protein
MKFALNAAEKHGAISCESEWGPLFGSGCDIAVSDGCNTNTESSTHFGISSLNDTGLHKSIGFTGSEYFQVKEIEVFEITT